MKTVQIECPACGRTDLLPLDTSSMPVVVTCPSCYCSFLNYQKKSVALDQDRIKELFNEGDLEKINRYFWDVLKSDISPHPCSCSSVICSHSDGICITKDDITNLKITLAFCNSVEDVLAKI
jgi:hypothetical protein